MTDKPEFAFPSEYYVPEIFAERCAELGVYEAKREATGISPGMTLRDYFAAKALAGVGTWMPISIDDHYLADLKSTHALKVRAEWAYRQADAMLAARSAEQ